MNLTRNSIILANGKKWQSHMLSQVRQIQCQDARANYFVGGTLGQTQKESSEFFLPEMMH